jgi:hypothetical protein
MEVERKASERLLMTPYYLSRDRVEHDNVYVSTASRSTHGTRPSSNKRSRRRLDVSNLKVSMSKLTC